MPNDWINDAPKNNDWLAKPSTETPSLKSLDEISDDRQKASEAPKPTPAPVAPPPPAEEIPYDKIFAVMEGVSTDILGVVARIDKASIDIRKISVIVSGNGEKGKGVLTKASDFQSRIETISSELKKISQEVAEYKNALPKDLPPQA